VGLAHRPHRQRASSRAAARCVVRQACSQTCSTHPGCECAAESVLECRAACSTVLPPSAAACNAGGSTQPSPQPPLAALFASSLLAALTGVLFNPNGICRCATCAIDPSWLEVENVDRRSGLSVAEFREQYEIPNKPVILTDVVSGRWGAGRTCVPLLQSRSDGGCRNICSCSQACAVRYLAGHAC